jgi:hypothetical protein
VADHTPGPWTMKPYIERKGYFWVGPDPLPQNRFAIAEEADAHLIAAAPDLLAALEAIVRQAEPLYAAVPDSPATHSAHVLMDEARAAIAKAKGEQVWVRP